MAFGHGEGGKELKRQWLRAIGVRQRATPGRVLQDRAALCRAVSEKPTLRVERLPIEVRRGVELAASDLWQAAAQGTDLLTPR